MAKINCDDNCSAQAEGGGRDDDVHFTLPRSALTVWQIRDCIGALVVAGLLAGIVHLPFTPQWLTAKIYVIGLILLTPFAIELLIMNRVRHSYYSISVHPDELVMSKGLLFRQVISIPKRNILNLRFRQGPILARFGLTSVYLLTIANEEQIGPLDDEQKAMIESLVGRDSS